MSWRELNKHPLHPLYHCWLPGNMGQTSPKQQHSFCVFLTSSCGTSLSTVNPVLFNQKYNRSQQPQRYEWSNSRKWRHFRSLCCNHSCLFFFLKTDSGLEHRLWALCPDWQMFYPQSLSRYPTLGPTLAFLLVRFRSIWLFYDGPVSHGGF